MATPWWQDPTTQAFNPPVEPGQDIGTPFHTPITALTPGTVAGVSYGGFGARVDITTPSGTDVYYQHLDQIAPGIVKGAGIAPGEAIGLSGGQLWGGSLPNNPQNSTGPHVEVGTLSPAGQPMNPSALIAGGPEGPPGIGSSGTQAAPPSTSFGFSAGGASFPGGSITGPSLTLPDPVAIIEQPFRDVWSAIFGVGGAKGWLSGNIFPLVIAGLVVLVVLGTGSGKQQTTNISVPVVPIPA